MALHTFHPAVQNWFNQTFSQATEVQVQSWSSIAQGQHTLLAAPTGSGKTLAAFLSAIDQLVKEGQEQSLLDQTRVLYISPLKALSNDIQINLQQPIQGVRAELLSLLLPDVDIQAWVRTGDTPQAERAKASKKPPHILVTTPESIYILLTSESGRTMLRSVRTVIVDEIHAIAGSKRGSHLCLSLERLQSLINETDPTRVLQRIGLSATQKPIDTMARFLMGDRLEPCQIIDIGHVKKRDLAIQLPDTPLAAVMSNDVWEEIYDRLQQLSIDHQTMLIFVNTRRLAERAARFIAERLGDDQVMAHHGSMAKEKRLQAEQKLKAGKLKCLVATASLELGIDIGDVDLVCQIGSPRSIAAFLQRVGRSGHHVDGMPKGRLFPTSRDDLVETVALLKAINEGELDKVIIPHQPLDILAQQIVAEVSGREWSLNSLYASFNRAWPYRNMTRAEFEAVVQMLAEGFSTRRGRRGAYLHFDAVNGKIRPRKSARTIALTNGGAIPDQFDCDVLLVPENLKIGTVGEDFAFESIPGDIFQLGNSSYKILKSETGQVFVEDAQGQPPTIPFWFGEAPGRTDELSLAVSQLREVLDLQFEQGIHHTQQWLQQQYELPSSAAEQLCNYLAAAKAALGHLPTQKHIVFERFFDEVGDMHFVVHSCYGSRVNKAWGLALRKRFCRKFNFELQASALEDSIVLSLSSTHSFAMEDVAKYLHANTVRDVLIQALLDVPMFPTRWRWNATIALAVLRNRFGKRSPPYFQRSDAEDLVAVLFPDQIACGENIAGDRTVPDHPLVKQTIDDCLHETMDVDGLIDVLKKIENSDVEVQCNDLSAPSPLSSEIINARPYAFLDDGDAEERRTMAIKSPQFPNPSDASRLRQLDNAAIAKVKEEAWPTVRSADELHDAMMMLGFLTEDEIEQGSMSDGVDIPWKVFFKELADSSRATLIHINAKQTLAVTAERLHEFLYVFPQAELDPIIQPVKPINPDHNAWLEIIRSRLEGLGPVTQRELSQPLTIDESKVFQVLLNLEQEGFVVRGHFCRAEGDLEWCERRLLARIHRYTLNRLRAEIEPVSLSIFMRFLFDWQHISEKGEGIDALAGILQQLEGYSVPAQMWQTDILPARLHQYTSNMLENLTLSGRFSWLRINVKVTEDKKKSAPVRLTPIALIQRGHLSYWRIVTPDLNDSKMTLSGSAEKVVNLLQSKGALFFMDIVQQAGLLKTQCEQALGELVNWGMVTSDSSAGLQALTTPNKKRPRLSGRRGRQPQSSISYFDHAGRWSLLEPPSNVDEERTELIAHTLLQRYGIVFKKLLDRESHLPAWRDLLKIYWRMEARGEIRGGRFVAGMSGEQFALPEAIASLRKIHSTQATNQLIMLSSADPLNLVGSILPGKKIPSSLRTHIVFKNGVAIAVRHDGEITYFENQDEETCQETRIAIGKHDQLQRINEVGYLR